MALPTFHDVWVTSKDNRLLMFLLATYFVVGWAILYTVVKPKSVQGHLAVAAGSIIWNIY